MKKSLKKRTLKGDIIPYLAMSGTGNINPELYGNISSELHGNFSPDLFGDISGIYGDCSDITGNLDECDISDDERKKGVDIRELIRGLIKTQL